MISFWRMSHAVAVLAVAGSLMSSHAFAQSGTYTIVASGLNAPRGLKFGPDGALYIAEGGTGGTQATTPRQCKQVPGPVGPYMGGNTGTIVKVMPGGTPTVVASGFPSTVASTGDLSSVADVAFLNGTLYALIAGGGCSHGNPSAPNGIAKVDPVAHTWTMLTNLSTFALSHPGKYDNAGDFEPDGVWFNMIPMAGKLVTIEPNRGIIIGVTPDGAATELVDISASQGHIVPTAIAASGGDIYVGNLLYFPILPNWSRILRVTQGDAINDGIIPGFGHSSWHNVVDSKAGFTTIMAVNFGPDGLLYALELSDMAGYPAPGNGKVVRVNSSGEIEEVVTGLNVPGGMTWGPGNRLYVSDFSAVPAPGYGAGRVLAFEVTLGN